MLFILWCSLLLILLNPTRSTEHIFGEFPQENDPNDEVNDFAENVAGYEENDPQEQTEFRSDVSGDNYQPITKSSDEIRLDSGTYFPQDETNSDLERESLTRSHDSEFKESSEINFIGHSTSSINQKPAYQVDAEEGSEFYSSSGNGHASPTPEDWNQVTQSIDEDHFQSPDSEATQFSESQLIEPEDAISDHDQSERSFTEMNEETRLNTNGEGFVLEAGSTVEQAENNINEESPLAETRENINLELLGKTELKFKEYAEAKDVINENNRLNQSDEWMVTRESAGSNESNTKQQTEVADAVKPIFHNGLGETSHIYEDDTEDAGGDEKEKFNSSVAEVNQDNMNNSETKLSNINSQGEQELKSKLLQRSSNVSEALSELKTAVKKNFTRSNNANEKVHSGYSKGSVAGNIDSEHTIGNFSFSSENDKPTDSSKNPYSTHRINYQSKPDNSIQENAELLDVENNHDLINSYEVKTNEKESVTCETSRDCLLTTTAFDDKNADISSKLTPNTLKEDRIRDVGNDLEVTSDSKLVPNDSAQEESKGSFEYLENIEFNLQEFLHIVKTDKNFQAFIYNSIILYVPVLICDALLWIVIVKLARHIRRQIVLNLKPKLTESLVVHHNESEDFDRPISFKFKSQKDEPNPSRKDSGEDLQNSSYELLCSNSEKVWYPPR